jgi:molecular chaperone GrpE
MARHDADPDSPRWPAPQASPEAAPTPAQAPPVPSEADEDNQANQANQADQVGPGRTADLEDRLRRALADVDNMRKRCERQVTEARAEERARVAAAWLPVVDNLERALDHADADPSAVIEGVRAVRDQAVALLGSIGFARHDETDVPFDPQLHEAVSVVPDGDAPAGTVLQVLRPGYGEGNRQLRPAAVVVAGGPG